MSRWHTSAPGELLGRLLDCRAAGRADVPISGDDLADLVCELLSLAETCDDLLDLIDDWKARAEAYAATAMYLRHLVEHQQRILAHREGEDADRDVVAVQIEADNIILFSQDTLRAIADLNSVTAPDTDQL